MEVAILKEIIKETDKNWRFIFESPLYDKIDFIPGQLVQIQANVPGFTEPVGRNYSVASWPDGSNCFELIVTYLSGGAMSEFLFNYIEPGDEILYKGPMGIFTLPDNLMDREIYFISTGSGISPFRSMINYLYENKVAFKKIKLFFGTRTQKDIVYREELEMIDSKLENFEYIPVLSRESGTGLKEGHVHKHYLDLIDKSSDKPLVYFCGWNIMINEGRQELKRRDFQMMKDIRVEIFG
jgi:CDP-4-dehydro-6-deoxyglucose reductase